MAFVRDIHCVLLPVWGMQIADINPSALHPNGMLMSCEFWIYRLRRGEERRPQSSVCVTLPSSPWRGCGGWGGGGGSASGLGSSRGSVPLLLSFPCPGKEPDLGFSVEFWWPFLRDPWHSGDEGEKWGYLVLGNSAVVSAIGISYRRVMNWGSFSSSKDNWFFS